ncbi:MAG: primosomal protein N' [Clostridia bacterium]|nr:primosomal protein N' [Clostridia bacterium]
MSSCVAAVVIDKSTPMFDRQYDYLLPVGTRKDDIVGCRVLVPFGKGNTKRQGFVLSVKETDNTEHLKSIISVVDNTPVLNDEMLKMVVWLKEHTFSTYFDAIHAVLPSGLGMKLVNEYSIRNSDFSALSGDELAVVEYVEKFGSATADKVSKHFSLSFADDILEKLTANGYLYKDSNPIRKVVDATVKTVRLTEPEPEDSIKLTPKQRSVVELLRDVGAMSVREITYFTGVSSVVINNLEKYGVVEFFDTEIYRRPDMTRVAASAEKITLTEEQQAVCDTVTAKLAAGEYAPVLLHGVTGSGKTQVFMHLVEKTVLEGRGVIVMVPEIALTPQMLELFYSRFGDKVAVFHSALPLGQRLDEWKRVKNGEALIALGTRSAIFAPLSNIGLIVMDEEQEHTYKSEQSPRFHTRDVAKFRSAYHSAVCLLCSATPSIESYSAAKAGKYTLCEINERYGNAVLPTVVPIDMRGEAAAGNKGTLSMTLTEELQKTLDDGKQAILLLNRRGHNTYISCPNCGYIATCENCSVSMTYHSASGRLMCHYCGHSKPYTPTCPNCGGNHLKYSGAGTQKLEDELKMIFPSARVLRLDADTTMAKNAFRDKLSAFARGEYDILLGTQMVAKGLNFPNVTLVGVISADQSMHSGDFRGFERTFSLLTQVVGRSGRGDSPGRAYIQTLDPENDVIKLAAAQDYKSFYEEEILTRKLMVYPPYCDILSVMTSAATAGFSAKAAECFVAILTELLKGDFADVKMIILRPTPTIVPRVNNRYRYRIVIKCRMNKRTRELINAAIDKYYKTEFGKKSTISVDVNPEGNV